MDCPRCGSSEHGKDGFAYGRQRYQCQQYQHALAIPKNLLANGYSNAE
jgi:transposase-like protein